MKVDKILSLIQFPGISYGADHVRRIRVLFAGSKERVLRGVASECRVLAEIASWPKREIDKLRGQLLALATSGEMQFGKNVKRVGRANKIVELRVGKRRVYCFVDAETGDTFIAAHTQSVNSGDKASMQDIAIREAEELRDRWIAATPLEGFEDARRE